MSARDDYAKLDATTLGLHHQGQTSTEAQAALDEIDRLRAELDGQAGRVGHLTALVEQCMEQRDAAEADADRLAVGLSDLLADSDGWATNSLDLHDDAVAKRGPR